MVACRRLFEFFAVIFALFPSKGASQESCVTPNQEIAQCLPLESCPVIFNGVKLLNATVIDFAKKSRCKTERKNNYVCCGTLNYVKVNVCLTPNQEDGECVSVELCPAIFEGLQNLNDAAIELARKSRCKTEASDVFVCCSTTSLNPRGDTKDEVVVQTSTPFITTKKPHKKTLVSDRTYCGYQHTDDRFYDSNDTAIDEFPWVALMIHSNDTGNEQQHCLGALINARYVLTTAICVSQTDAEEGFQITSVQLGEYNTSSTTDCVSFYDESECSEPVTKVAVESTIVHPNYKLDITGISYNIALIRLAKRVNFSDYVRPICLPNGKFKAQIGTSLTTTGWGTTVWEPDLNKKSKIKKRGKGTIVPIQECIEKSELNLEGAVSEEFHICLREDTPNGPCADDSSAPLMSKSGIQWQLEGILSFPTAQKCGVGSLNIYTNVTRHLEWIMENAIP